MNRSSTFSILILAMLLFIAGCSQSYLQQGDQALQNTHYQQALAYFEQALSERPNDPIAQRELGRVYYHLQDYEQAEKFLKAAQSRIPKDGTTILYLGLLAEAKLDFAAATEMYQKFLATNARSKSAPQIRGRLLYVQNEKLRQQVAEEIKTESSLSDEAPPDNTVGILPFVVPDQANETLRSLAQGMAAALWYDLASIKELQVVERLQLKYISEELAAAEKGFIAKDAGPRLGKLVKAKHLVKASLDLPTADKLSVQTGLINTGSAAYNPAYSTDDDLSKAMRVQREITIAVLDSLGIKVSGSERRAFKKTPTSSYAAFLAFSRGIEQFDQGQYATAGNFFGEAARLDPSFGLANTLRSQSELIMTNSGDLGKFGSGVQSNLTTGSKPPQNQLNDLRDITTPPGDPRHEDLPTTTTGTATVSGSIR
jgi:tetratricopeptide (TPR) repeat protein